MSKKYFAIAVFLMALVAAPVCLASNNSSSGNNSDRYDRNGNYSRDNNDSGSRYGYDRSNDRIYRNDYNDNYDTGRNRNAASYPDYRNNGNYYNYENYNRNNYSYYNYDNFGYRTNSMCNCPTTYGYNYNYSYNTAPGATNYTRPSYGCGNQYNYGSNYDGYRQTSNYYCACDYNTYNYRSY